MDDVVEKHKDQQDKSELLLWAAARGLLADLQELVSQGADFAAKDKGQRTAAHYAAAHGHASVLEFLSTRGVDLDAEDAQGRGPLHYAALGDHAPAVELLCAKGCWVDAPDGADNTPLHLAARGLPPSVDAQAALASASSTAAAASTATSISASSASSASNQGSGADKTNDKAAGEHGPAAAGPVPAQPLRQCTAALRALLAAGAKKEVRNGRGLTPLGEAVASNNAGAVAVLLDQHAAATITCKSYSLLHLAAGLGHVECLERLLVEGRRPETDSTDNAEGTTPLHAALASGHWACAKVLLERGADGSVPDAQGRLPLQLLPATAPSAAHQTPSSRADLQWLRQRLERSAAKSASGKLATASPAAASPATTTTTSVSKAAPAVSAASGKSTQPTTTESATAKAATPSTSAEPNKSAVKPESSPAASQATAASAASGQDKAAAAPSQPQSSQQAFRALDRKDQVRKVMLWAGMPDSELRLLTFPPSSALGAIQAVRKAHGLHACWEAVAAIRQDEAFQEDAVDPHIKEAIEDLKRPNVDPTRYMSDRQVQSVFGKMNKLQGIVRQHGQGFKVTLEDLVAKPHGPSSVAETLKQLKILTDKLQAAQDAAIAAVAGLPPPKSADEEAEEEGGAQQGAGSKQGKGKAKKDGDVASKLDQAAIRRAHPLLGQPLDPVDEREETKGRGAHIKEGLQQGLRQLLWHALRAVFAACLMLSVMWAMGLMPEQINAKVAEQQRQLQDSLRAQHLSSVETPSAGRAGLLDGLGESEL